jgi:hypothetical protein
MKPYSALNDHVNIIMTYTSMLCHFIDVHQSIIQNHVTDFLLVVLCIGC